MIRHACAARAASACAVLSALLWLAAPVRAQRASYEEIQTFSAVLNLIRLNHVDTVSYSPLVRAAIEGALEAMDPHSRYVRREAAAVLQAARSGELGSAGIELDGMRGTVTVIAVGVGGPGEKAGLLAGDRIVAVQDSSVAGLAPHEVELLLAGPHRTERRVRVERGDPNTPQQLELRLRLERYAWPDVTTQLMLAGDAGYVRFSGFGHGAAAELERALESLKRSGMKRLVLDLRGNPGGLLTEAVSAAGLFLPKDALVFRTAGRRSDSNTEHRTRSNGPFRNLPLVILVDGGSASAAEAMAGALQDHGRAHVAGHRTFGKALVQQGFPLPAGDVVWLTVARILTPNGRMIQRSYDGLSRAQYAAAAESLRRGGPDAAAAGSGGVEPQTWFHARPAPPVWWSDVRRGSLDLLAVQRASLDGDALDDWKQPLLAALRQVLQEELGSSPAIDADQERAMARHLTILAIGSRRGDRAALEYDAHTDAEVAHALSLLDGSGPAR